ncbi:MAG: hypothetical protein GY696_16105 [Gammaproteobacteria bacterium]|nr:hypothetical protein [Gammaproteobacteria bacterium]
MSVAFDAKIRAAMEPYKLEVGIAAHGGSLDVVGKIAKISMAVSANTVLELTDIIVIRNLSHPLNFRLGWIILEVSRGCRFKGSISPL